MPRRKPKFLNLHINLPTTPIPPNNPSLHENSSHYSLKSSHNDELHVTPKVSDGTDIDVFPNVPQWNKDNYDIKSTKFIAYLPHSGFHNQRIELENALTISRILNRTLLMPNFRLGLAVSWSRTSQLQEQLVEDQKSNRQKACRHLANRRGSLLDPCHQYNDYTEVSPSFFLDPENLKNFSVLYRGDISRSFYFSEQGLGLSSENDVYTFSDKSRYDNAFLENSNSHVSLSRYSHSLNFDELSRPPYSDYSVLQLGSLFGTGRLKLKTAYSSEILAEARKAMLYRLQPLDNELSQVVQLLGGPENFIGLHIRVGDGIFKTNRFKNVDKAIKVTLRKLGENAITVQEEVRKYQALTSSLDQNFNNEMGQDDLSPYQNPSISPLLMCRKPLYTAPNLQVLNMPIYVASDSRNPSRDPALAKIYNIFPCVFSLDDFKQFKTFTRMSKFINTLDGLKLGPFLIPFVDAIIAAQGRYIIGTSGSTFSSYASKILYPFFREKTLQEITLNTSIA